MRTSLSQWAAAVCLLLAAVGTVTAQNLTGPYVGVSVGTLDHEERDGDTPELNANADVHRLFGGYRASRHFAIEGAWTAADDLRDDAGVAFPAFPGAELETQYEILAIKAMAVWPIRRIGFFHGIGYYDSKADATIARNGAQLVALEDDENGLLIFGGLGFDFSRVSLRAEYQWHDNVNGADVTDTTLGVSFRF
jgi:Outer membrane protein beta-barrel domain